MSDFSWEHLLQRIEQGVIVPIIGRDVLQVEVNGKKTMLYTHLASRLAATLGVTADLTGPNPLNDVAVAYLEESTDNDLDDVYLALNTLTDETASLEIPESLRQLAAIRPLKLFLTTTIDPMLQRAIDTVRYNSAMRTQVLAFGPNRTDDISAELLKKDLPIVFHVLGKAGRLEYAVTEEDTLEFVHSLQDANRWPKDLFNELDQRFLLIIGNKFDDWLARFFIRSAKRERMASRRGDFVADDYVTNEGPLLAFFRRFRKMKIFTTAGPIDFIDQLHKRWMEKHGDDDPDAPLPTPGEEIVPGSIFISYLSSDSDFATKVRDALDGQGLDVWLDRDRLAGGDKFGPKIEHAINQSAVFLPIISRGSLGSRPHYFEEEWKHAIKLDKRLPETVPFIMPVVIDDTPYSEPALPQRFRDITWEKLDGTFPRDEFVKNLRATVKRYRRDLVSRPS